jgi:hypothetical protein
LEDEQSEKKEEKLEVVAKEIGGGVWIEHIKSNVIRLVA